MAKFAPDFFAVEFCEMVQLRARFRGDCSWEMSLNLVRGYAMISLVCTAPSVGSFGSILCSGYFEGVRKVFFSCSLMNLNEYRK